MFEIGLGTLVAVADRVVASIVDDVRLRTRKLSIRALDEFKAVPRYAVWLLGALVVLLIFLALVVPPAYPIVFAVGSSPPGRRKRARVRTPARRTRRRRAHAERPLRREGPN